MWTTEKTSSIEWPIANLMIQSGCGTILSCLVFLVVVSLAAWGYCCRSLFNCLLCSLLRASISLRFSGCSALGLSCLILSSLVFPPLVCSRLVSSLASCACSLARLFACLRLSPYLPDCWHVCVLLSFCVCVLVCLFLGCLHVCSCVCWRHTN